MADTPSRPLVLVVDDEPTVLEATRRQLERDFQVETAVSAEEAELFTGTQKYDVIVCDHMLPGEQGLEFLARLADRQPDAARILLTGYMNPELLSRSVVVARLSACLLKPLSREDLVKAIWKALKK